MQNCLFLFPNLSDAPKGAAVGATLSGPSWARPLSNLQDPRLSNTARSVDTNPVNTQFDAVFNRFCEIRGIVLINNNFSVTARIRVTAWYEEGSYLSYAYQAEFDAYPSIYFTEDSDWESDGWWDGKDTDANIEGFTQNAILILPEPMFCSHWRIEVIDDSNPAGYVEIGRLWMATGWQPSSNPMYGAALGYEDDTTFEKSLSGAEYSDDREPYRVFNIGFDYLPEQEGLSRGLEMMRRAGTKGQVFYVHRPDDPINITRLSLLCRFRNLEKWEQVVFERSAIGFEMKEIMP